MITAPAESDRYGGMTRREDRTWKAAQTAVKERFEYLLHDQHSEHDTHDGGHCRPVITREDERQCDEHRDRDEDLRMSDLAQQSCQPVLQPRRSPQERVQRSSRTAEDDWSCAPRSRSQRDMRSSRGSGRELNDGAGRLREAALRTACRGHELHRSHAHTYETEGKHEDTSSGSLSIRSVADGERTGQWTGIT